MSRPPRFRTRFTTTGDPLPGQAFLDYLPDEYGDFLAMERGLATSELGFPATTAEGDFAGTLMEMSALVAHVLSLYQDRYANEAFLPTARSPKSLVRHGRRLAYEPNPGLSATGHLLIHPKEGLSGTIPKGFGLSSASIGEKKAQDYETLEDIDIDAAFDGVLPLNRTQAITLGNRTSFQVAVTGLDLAAGEYVIVKGSLATAAAVVASAVEDLEAGTTTVTLKTALPSVAFGTGVEMLAKPQSMHLFGWDSSGATFPDAQLQLGAYPGDPAVGSVAYGYTAAPTYSNNDIYLAEELKTSVAATPVVRLASGSATLFTIATEATIAATFKRVEHIKVNVTTTSNGTTTTVTGLETYPATSITKTVTAITITGQPRTAQQIRTSVWLLGWSVTAPIVVVERSQTPVTQPLTLDTKATGWKPGQLALLSTQDGDTPEVHEVVRLVSVAKDANGHVQVAWEMVNPTSGVTWKLGFLRVFGNVVPISHGKTVSEVLGDSDGVTPLLRFSLKQKPVTELPTAEGATPAIEIRVAQILWEAVPDFETATEHDRVYVVQRDHTAAVTIVFGDGRKGAIPAAGKKHITATYRIGVGADGDASAKAVSRIKKASPIVDRAENPLPITNGADPADPDMVRTQATGPVKTFDRAVSVPDHRDLALLFPGVAKARALWTLLPFGEEGVRVVVANALGLAPVIAEVRAFLQSRRDDSVPLEVVGASPVDLIVRIHLETDPAYLPEIVKSAVVDALTGTSEDAPGLFTFASRNLGQPAFLSEVYERLERVEGAASIVIWHFDSVAEANNWNPKRVADTITAEPDNWLRLLPENVKLEPLPQGGP
jgi:hypothetical protein